MSGPEKRQLWSRNGVIVDWPSPQAGCRRPPRRLRRSAGACSMREASAKRPHAAWRGCSRRLRSASTHERPAPRQQGQRVSAPLPKKGKRQKECVQSRCRRCQVPCPRFPCAAALPARRPGLLLAPVLASAGARTPPPPMLPNPATKGTTFPERVFPFFRGSLRNLVPGVVAVFCVLASPWPPFWRR